MKKCALILMAILTIAACNKKEKPDNVETNTSADPETLNAKCITLEEYYTISDLDKKTAWLKKKGHLVCPDTLEKAVLKIHEVKGTVSNKKGKYAISWGKLKGIIKEHGYDAYLSVVIDKEQIVSVEMVPDYTKGKYCFSTALIKSLAKKYVKNNDSEFEFSLATLTEKSTPSTEPVVIIQVNGAPYYYDYSTEPPIHHVNNLPL
ncbi:hypothetical protein [Flavobacterium sp. KACC 22763]|uniref:hypothetical protein n=1 Tax=Flavobacterium sp. KACC 22763 TaxID=3025668 RepID=UPI002366D497|nr:hypothetical protein [Flavobacterium sp. KACC 22763]WDF65980.1 hypothetical protein PQ463_07355 [Flavobacterium sp. KACC 22763]